MLAGFRKFPVRARALSLIVPSLLAGLLLAAPAAAAPVGRGVPPVSVVAEEPAPLTVGLSAEATGVGTVRLVVAVSGPDGAPLTGTAELAEGHRVLTDGLAVTGGRAVHELTGVAPGEHTYTVTFHSADGGATGTGTASVTVAGRAAPALTLTASSPAVGAVRVVVGLSVDGVPLPGGSVELREGSGLISPALPVVDGTASYEMVRVAPGPHTYTVTYAGSDAIAPVSQDVTVDVRNKDAAVLTVESASPRVGELELSVGVAAAGSAVTGGTVTVKEGGTVRATALPVSDGIAVWTAKSQTPGSHTYTVSYSGTATVRPASTTTTATVTAPAKPTLRVTATSPLVGELTLRVGVTAEGTPVTGGTVTILEGTTTRASGLKVSNGYATWSAKKLTSGRHTYAVSYTGTAEVTKASTTTTATVKAKAKPTVKPTASSPVPNKLVLKVTVTATGQSRLGGTVTVKEGSKTVKTGLKVSGGTTSWSPTTIKAGRHTYSVSYGGTSQVAGGTAKVSVTIRAVKTYANCSALNRDYPHGVGRTGARDKVSGRTDPVTDFAVHTGLYNANKKSDRDKDGVACEKQ